MPATFSPEGKIESGLRELGCAGRVFVEIAQGRGIKVSQGKFSECLNDKSHFDEDTSERLLELFQEMKQLQEAMKVQGLQISEKVPVAWGQTDRIVTALVLQIFNKIRAEENSK